MTQLCREHGLLDISRCEVVVIVETDFAYGTDPCFTGHGLVEIFQRNLWIVPIPGRRVRMHTRSKPDLGPRRPHDYRSLDLLEVVGRQYHERRRDPGGARTGHDLVEV